MDRELIKELIQDHILESQEGLDLMEHELLELEKGEYSKDSINNIFRVMHTIKGSSASLGLDKLERISHKAENLLSEVRSDTILLTPDIISLSLKVVDAVRDMFKRIDNEGNEGAEEYIELQEQLQQASKSNTNDTVEHQFSEKAVPEEQMSNENNRRLGIVKNEDPSDLVETTQKEVNFTIKPAEITTPEKPVLVAFSTPQNVSEPTVRITVKQLDELMNLVGELVLTRNQVIQTSAVKDDERLSKSSQRLNYITSELQQGMMKTRMQAVENAWTRFPRIVRDLSSSLHKKVRLSMEGQETDLDRTLLDAIKDPLLHLVRNAIDHGLETPEERLAAGKDEEGILQLKAYHEGGQVIIEIIDDGRGIDPQKIKESALSKGIIQAEQGSEMSDQELKMLIFHPGFSTAKNISTVSGRGVGMDVVRSNIEKIGGSIELDSIVGLKTTVRIKIPLTLAIIQTLIVSTSGESFAIPQVALQELIRIEGVAAEKAVEYIFDTPVYRLRGNILPLVYLNEFLNLPPKQKEKDIEDRVLFIVVLYAEGHPYGLVVDEINDSEEIVVKPLGKQLSKLKCYAGGTIMGSGKVALILDPNGIAEMSRVHQNKDAVNRLKLEEEGPLKKMTALLLFKVGKQYLFTVPLSKISRIEEVPLKKCEMLRNEKVISLRGQIIRIIELSDYIPGLESVTANENGMIQLLLHTHGEHTIAIMVSEVIDINHVELKIQNTTATPGINGAVAVDDQLTEIIDIESIIKMANPHFYDESLQIYI